MRTLVSLLKRYPAARWMFTARLQSELASGAAWVALVLIAYARLHSAWAVTFVLLADFLPGTSSRRSSARQLTGTGGGEWPFWAMC